MTERLYERDAYLSDFEAVVVDQDGSLVVLDQTAFRPDLDGQPQDRGVITGPADSFSARVVRVDGSGLWHRLDLAGLSAARGLHRVQVPKAASGSTAPRHNTTLVGLFLQPGDHIHGQLNWAAATS